MLANTLREARRKRAGASCISPSAPASSRASIEQIEDESPSYVPSEGNTALLAQALRVPVGSLLTERNRLVERLPH